MRIGRCLGVLAPFKFQVAHPFWALGCSLGPVPSFVRRKQTLMEWAQTFRCPFDDSCQTLKWWLSIKECYNRPVINFLSLLFHTLNVKTVKTCTSFCWQVCLGTVSSFPLLLHVTLDCTCYCQPASLIAGRAPRPAPRPALPPRRANELFEPWLLYRNFQSLWVQLTQCCESPDPFQSSHHVGHLRHFPPAGYLASATSSWYYWESQNGLDLWN